jgi:hypothetical protein
MEEHYQGGRGPNEDAASMMILCVREGTNVRQRTETNEQITCNDKV